MPDDDGSVHIIPDNESAIIGLSDRKETTTRKEIVNHCIEHYPVLLLATGVITHAQTLQFAKLHIFYGVAWGHP